MDSGGSTGRLRDQLGVLPPGDLRQSLVALSESEEIWRKLFTYRFANGDFEGHSFGNIFLSALEKITGSNEQAIELATKLLKTKGNVIPVTLSNSTLCAKYADGTLLEGETLIDESNQHRARIHYMYLQPEAVLNPHAEKAILAADYIIFGPGDLYTSIIPNLIVEGVDDAVRKSKAKKILLVNLMTKKGQTEGFKASDFVEEMERYVGSTIFDYIVVNKEKPSKELLQWYKKSEEVEEMVDDLDQRKFKNSKLIRANILNQSRYEQSIADRIKRSLIRHDPDRVAKVIMSIINP
jgi:uncharacterized cofD-like protein